MGKKGVYSQIIRDCQIGKDTKIWHYVNLYECKVGDQCTIGSFVEIQKGVEIGNRVKISSHSFICEGVIIEDKVFIGHHVVFINDRYPRATKKNGSVKEDKDWQLLKTQVKKGASIGSNATILGGIIIGENSIIGAGTVVTKDVPKNTIVVGTPARIIGKVKDII